MTEEFNLSDKMGVHYENYPDAILVEDVKEFIRLLKEEAKYYVKAEDVIISIDKLAGEKLK